MKPLLKFLLEKITPRMLRGNDPRSPWTVRRRIWFLQESRFLILTRRGPFEIIVKPSHIVGAAFVGIVGTSVIAATTVFIGVKSVEVVSKDTITAAIASAPVHVEEISGSNGISPHHLADLVAEGPNANDDLAHFSSQNQEADDAIQYSALTTSIPAAPEVTMKDGVASTHDDHDHDHDLNFDLDLENGIERDHGLDHDLDSDLDEKTQSEIANDDTQPKDGGGAGESVAGISPSLEGLMPMPIAPPVDRDMARAGYNAANDTGAMEPFDVVLKQPIFTAAVRQRKMLRSMAREIRMIRHGIADIGVSTVHLPIATQIYDAVEQADFATMVMAVEEHRSILRKLPLAAPMRYYYISSKFGKRRHPVTKKYSLHKGIDLAGTWQEEVNAAAPGNVIYAGRMGTFGNVVKIRHAFGVVTTYAHLAKISVRKGADVAEGTVIGKMGRTGRVAGAHLHYEIAVDGKAIDPLTFIIMSQRLGVGGQLMRASDE